MRHERSLYAASNARKLPFEGAQQRASTFLLKHSFYGFQGAKLCWLAGEMTKYREGTRGGGGAKGTNIPVWGQRRTNHRTMCGKGLRGGL